MPTFGSIFVILLVMFPAYDDRSAKQILHFLKTKKSAFWEQERVRRPLELFHSAAREVPAYKDFLRKNRVSPAKVKTLQDFQNVPWVNKKNYLRQYPLEKLVWRGDLKKKMIFTATSGSTGKPFYFPREQTLDWQSSIYHEMFLNTSGFSREKSTLVIVGFGMGMWIGGLITYRAFSFAAARGWPVTLLTPGANKREILDAIKNIGNKFDQIILCGYPPFLKDVIDGGAEEGIRWWKFDMRIVFAAESFSEEFRDYMIQMIGKKDKYRTTMNVYGSADLGTMAEETPLSVFVRRIAVEHPGIYQNIFGGVQQLPTLAQFNPLFINFEAPEGEILCTADNTVPLIRYQIGDHGGTLSFDQVADDFSRADRSLLNLVKSARLGDAATRLPFVYVYERSDFSVKLYGAIIYPEHIKVPLLAAGFRRALTGKFKMATRHNKAHQEYLELNVELKSGAKTPGSLTRKIEQSVIANLLKKNAEYHYLYGLMPKRVTPKIIFREYGHPEYFRAGVKQKWVEKNDK